MYNVTTELVALIAAFLAPFAPAEVNAMGSCIFADRERATAALVAADRRGADLAEFWATWHLDAEVRSRCRRVAETYYRIDGPDVPWISTPGDTDPVKAYTIAGEFRQCLNDAIATVGHGGDETWREATIIWVRRQIRNGVPRAEVNRALDLMRATETAWKKRFARVRDNNDEVIP